MRARRVNSVAAVLILLTGALASGDISTGLVGHWPLDGNAQDASGNNHHGTQVGNPTYIGGMVRQAISLDGDGDYVDCTNNAAFDITSAITVSAWIKVNTFDKQWQYVVGKGDNAWRMVRETTTNVMRWRANGPTPNLIVTGKVNVNDGQWHHLAGTYDGSTAVLYVDGVVDASLNCSGAISKNTYSVWIGQCAQQKNRAWNGLIDEVRVYSRALSASDVRELVFGPPGLPDDPVPGGDANDVPVDAMLSWTTGEYAVTHDVYLGKDFASVSNATVANPLGVLLRAGHDANTFDPGPLELSTKYYWRVDEVNGPPDRTVYKGDVWSFMTEPVAYLIRGVQATASSSANADAVPVKTVDQSGLIRAADGTGDLVHGTNDTTMWQSDYMLGLPATIAFEFDRPYKLHQMKVWNHNTSNEGLVGLGAREVTIEIADSNEGPWTPLADVTLTKAPGTSTAATDTIPIMGATASNVRLTIRSVHGTFVPAAGLAEVQFFYLPVAARELAPTDGAALTGTEVTLAWRSGREAAEHKVYLATENNRAQVEGSNPAVLAATIAAQGSYASYTASNLMLSQTYLWKIAEVNAAQTPATHDSPVLSFTTPAFDLVDDMESYTDEPFKEIWAAWLDGTEFGTKDPTNGSIVGADPAAGDYNVAPGRNGGQSLPIWFTNTATAPKSEAIRRDQFGNWTRSGITTLSLFVRKGAANTGGSLYLKINSTKVPLVDAGTYPSGFDPGWVRYNIDLTGMNVSNVTSLAVGVEGVGAMGVIYVDDIRLYAEAPELTTLATVGAIIEAESGTITAPFQVLSDKPEASGGKYIMVPNGAGSSGTDPATRDNGWAVYTINVPADGDYVIAIRGFTQAANNGSDDSIWVNIPGMIVKADTLHASGWIRCDTFLRDPAGAFIWDLVRETFSGNTEDPVVLTLTKGPHELQISRREDGTGLDAIAIFALQ